MKKLYSFLLLLFLLSKVSAQTANTPPLPAGETVIGGHLHAGSGNEVWTDANALYFNYRGNATTTYFWNLGGSTGKSIMTLINTGKIGIGTTSPSHPLTVRPSTDIDAISWQRSIDGLEVGRLGVTGTVGTGRYGWIGLWNTAGVQSVQIDAGGGISFLNSGNVGIGTSSPSQKLTISGGKIRLEDETNSYQNLIYASLSSSNYRSGQMIESNGSINFGLNGNKQAGFVFRWLAKDNSAVNYFDDSNELMRLTFDGKLGIGTTNPGNYKLNVEGSIRAKEIVVNTTGADFVFEPAYQLMSLQELETYLQTNRHLPGIASASEMQENGVSAGEMQTKLLQKVEELTLYVIELKKEIELLKQNQK